VCSVLGTRHRIGGIAQPHTRSLGPHIDANQQGRHRCAFNAGGKVREEKKRVKRLQRKKRSPVDDVTGLRYLGLIA
jgi:hypothetical protein